jgi:homoserine O-acetyltransferase/O-succinyltransferase
MSNRLENYSIGCRSHRTLHTVCAVLLGLGLALVATAPAHAEYESSYYTQAIHGPYEIYDLGDFALEDGGTLHGAKLAYHTLGTLNAAKDNAILVCTWYSGTTKIMEQAYTGKGRALDPDKYFIILVNQFGDGLSSSPHNTPGTGGMAGFPHVRIGDDVRAQHKMLTEKWGLTQLALVVGGSQGGEQTWEWAVRYPDMVKRAAPIATLAKTSNNMLAWGHFLDEAVTSDPGWNGGYYKTNADVAAGMRRLSAMWDVYGWCPGFHNSEIWRKFGFSSAEDFRINFMDAFFLPQDPDDLLSTSWKWERADVSRNTNGDLAAALGRIKAKVFVMPISTDLIFPVNEVAAEQKMVPNSELRVINSAVGHLGLFAVEGKSYKDQIDKNLNELLAIKTNDLPAVKVSEVKYNSNWLPW